MGDTGGFSKSSWVVFTDFLEALGKLVVTPNAVLEQLLQATARGLKLLKHFAWGQIKFVN